MTSTASASAGCGAGAVASWAATGWGVAAGHDYLQKGFYDAVFNQGVTRLGDCTQARECDAAGRLQPRPAGIDPDGITQRVERKVIEEDAIGPRRQGLTQLSE